MSGGGEMTPEQAKAYLEKTMWYEMAELAKIQPMPDEIRKLRVEVYEILKKEEQEWKTSSKQ